MTDLPPVLDKPWITSLIAIAELSAKDPHVAALAASATGLGLYKRSATLAFATFYGGYVTMMTVNSIANSIGSGLGNHAFALSEVFTSNQSRNG